MNRTEQWIYGAGILGGMLAASVMGTRRLYDLRGKTTLITGGSRGLGLLLARQFASAGARVAITARDPEELSRAADNLRQFGLEVFPVDADMTMRDEVEAAVGQVREKLGPVDVLVNNAGTITVGPAELMTIDDYRTSINTHFWGPYFTTMAVLPDMQRRSTGRIVNISSIGGKISVPHLLPYSVGKFALTGFSEGLRAELHQYNIRVTTVCPGLMRTGSPRNALFKGNNKAEYAWFSLSDSLPLISMSAERAASQIFNACRRGDAEVVLSLPAKLAVKLHGLAPGTTTNLLSLVNRLLPAAQGSSSADKTGSESFSRVSPSWLTVMNERAAERNNEIA
jgi:short-subunit dehydrogenase